ncbi:hypothetical protein F5Y15DRAFT_416267 [Xylariaceae sp. FL0016]|nr:hypothetical protein F5Y15DRAFT_416267 [Xylariaceae sp. FL0016]
MTLIDSCCDLANASHQLRPYIATRPHRALAKRGTRSLLLQERVHHLDTLAYVGFREDMSCAILEYWITLKVYASSGSPYSLLGVALAALAEVEEVHDYHSLESHKKPSMVSRSDWPLLFAQVLHEGMLRHIGNAHVYSAPSFTNAKLLVCRIIQGRWRDIAWYA